ncbi:MAG TPA: hypothetical protein VF039_08640 [Longimicrobiales bacterium]
MAHGSELSTTNRVADMLRRLERRFEQAEIDPAAAASVLNLISPILELRGRTFGGEHFETLHPARTLLILLDDCAVTDPELLAAAATIESEHPTLRPAARHAIAARVPLPDVAGDALLEELVAADPPVRLIALAERLDHARHLHLRERALHAGFHRGIGEVYAPVAARTHPRLARRYDWWWHTFLRRFLTPSGDA